MIGTPGHIGQELVAKKNFFGFKQALRTSVSSLGLLSTLFLPAVAQESVHELSIRENALSEALEVLQAATGVEILFPSNVVAGKQARAVQGAYTVEKALAEVLKGTGLKFDYINENAILVRRDPNYRAGGDESQSLQPRRLASTTSIRRDDVRSPDSLAMAEMLSAQPETAGAAQPIAQSASDASTAVEQIVVTGSRIRRANFSSTPPTLVLDDAFLDDRGFTNIADAFGETPAFGVGQNSNGEQARQTVGANFADFFGLGSQRTLTLVNGRRFVTSNAPTAGNQNPGLQVNLNNIPVGLIERVETVAIGGAPIYGSDAIAGTVNIIYKDDFEGFEASGQIGNIADEGSSSESYLGQLLMGANFDDGRGNVTLAYEYNEQNGLIAEDRPRTARNLAFVARPPDSDSDAANVLAENVMFPSASVGGAPLLFNFIIPNAGVPDPNSSDPTDRVQFGPDGSLVNFDVGAPTGAFFTRIGGDGFAQSLFQNVVSPVERHVITGIGHYDVTDWMTGFVELSYADSLASQLIDQPTFQTRSRGLREEESLLRVPLANPFLKDSARQTIFNAIEAARNPDTGALPSPELDKDGDGVPDTFFLARINDDILGSNASTEGDTETYRTVLGLRGDFTLADRRFDWEASYNLGRSRTLTERNGINSGAFFNALDAVALTEEQATMLQAQVDGGAADFQAVDSETGEVTRNFSAGDIVCRVAVDPPTNIGAPLGVEDRNPFVDGCVPLNLFGQNAAVPESIDFVRVKTLNRSEAEQEVFNVNLTGDLFTLPAGNVAVALGYEHREEEGEFFAGGFSEAGFGISRFGGVPQQPTDGIFNTDEVFGELLVPVISPEMDIAFARRLQLEGAIRNVDNSLAGSDVTWTAGGRWSPFEDITVRGNFTRSIRAPAIAELFLPEVGIQATANDPCDSRNSSSGPNAELRQENCRKIGIDPTSFRSIVQDSLTTFTQSGNSNLENEVADAWTVGAVIQPRVLPGLSLAVDWQSVSLSDAIVNLDGTAVMAACFDSENFDELRNTEGSICDRIRRSDDPDNFNQVTTIQTGFANAGSLEFSGLTVDLSYESDLAEMLGANGNWGAFAVSGNYFFLDRLETSVTGSDLNINNGEIGNSTHEFQLNWRYMYRGLDLLWQTRYIGKAKFDANEDRLARDPFFAEAFWVNNLTLNYAITPWVKARMIVDNVLDNSAPEGIGALGVPLSPYMDGILGRRWTWALDFTF